LPFAPLIAQAGTAHLKDPRPDGLSGPPEGGDDTMKRLFLAVLTILSLGAGIAQAQSYTHGYPDSSSAARSR